MNKYLSGAVVAASLMVASNAQAHFQLVYTPKVNFTKAQTVPLKLIFWHPYENGHAMDMEKPIEFYAVHKGKKIDLMDSLKETTFKSPSNEAKAFDGAIKLKRGGDYIVVVKPQPYLEPSEDIYIQHITKSFLNKGGVPTGWNEPVGLKTEIVPLNKPNNIVVGSTFTGRVISDGAPVAGAEIEVEYMTSEPDMATGASSNDRTPSMPGGAMVAISDANGYFTFGIPKAGFWGFAALGAGPDKEFGGKELSQDAVIWIRAYDLD